MAACVGPFGSSPLVVQNTRSGILGEQVRRSTARLNRHLSASACCAVPCAVRRRSEGTLPSPTRWVWAEALPEHNRRIADDDPPGQKAETSAPRQPRQDLRRFYRAPRARSTDRGRSHTMQTAITPWPVTTNTLIPNRPLARGPLKTRVAKELRKPSDVNPRRPEWPR